MLVSGPAACSVVGQVPPEIDAIEGGPATRPDRRNSCCCDDVALSRPGRLRDFEYRGRYTYFLTFCAYRRQDTLRDPSIAAMVVEQILRAARTLQFEVSAYCVMPNHAHLLVRGQSDRSDLHRFIKRVKQSSGQVYAAAAGQPLWQDSYYDHVVRPEENLTAIARYIIENPERAGLTRSSLDYPFVGSTTWSIEEVLKAR